MALLVGAPSRLKSHMKTCRELGFGERHVSVVERDSRTYAALEKERSRQGLACTIHRMPMSQYLKHNKVGFLGFDALGFDADARRTLKQAFQQKLAYFSCTFHTRRSPKKRIWKFLKKVFRGYLIWERPYRGKGHSPMVQFIFRSEQRI